MKFYQIIVQLLLLLTATDAMSCKYGGRPACIASCVAQNCATGYCAPGPDQICVCSRCGTGPPIPR